MFANPRQATNFITNGSLNVNTVIRAVISGDVKRLVKKNKLPRGINMEDLKDRIAERMWAKIKERGKYIRKNWSKELDKAFLEISEMDGAESKRATQSIPEGPVQMAEGVGCVKKKKTKPVVKPETGKVPRGVTFKLSLSELPDSYSAGDTLKIKSYDFTIKIDKDGRVTGKYTVEYNIHTGVMAGPGTDYSEKGTMVQAPGPPPVSNWPVALGMETSFQRTTLTGNEAGEVNSRTYHSTGSIRSITEGNGQLSLGYEGLLAEWEVVEASQSARIR